MDAPPRPEAEAIYNKEKKRKDCPLSTKQERNQRGSAIARGRGFRKELKEKHIVLDREKGRIELSEKAIQLLRLVPEDGSYVGNTFLRKRLGWPAEDDYWDARQELLNDGLIQTGKGRGGSVARIVASLEGGKGRAADVTAAEEIVSEIEEKAAKGAELVGDETELYEPLKKWIESTFGRPVEEVGDYFLVKITASPSGRKRESGQWSRPDVTSVQVNTEDKLRHVVVVHRANACRLVRFYWVSSCNGVGSILR